MSLRDLLPFVKWPLVINAPVSSPATPNFTSSILTFVRTQMGGFALADLAIAVHQAGGLGFIGSDGNMANLTTELTKVEESIDRHNDLLPIGVGVLSFAMKMPAVLDVIQRFRPSIVWLFAAKDINDYTDWAENVRRVSPKSQVWVQIGSVEGALHIAKNVKPDVMCIQVSE